MGERHSGGPAKCRVSLSSEITASSAMKKKRRLSAPSSTACAVRYPRAKINLTIEDVYGNIADAIKPENSACIDMLRRAMEIEHVTVKDIAMRGGTDGSFISTQGIPTPNYFTGAHNFHSACEFMPMSSWLKSLAVTGKDLIAAGMEPGKEIGEKLNELLALVIDQPELNTKEELLKHLG